MRHQHTNLLKASFIEQEMDPFTRRELTFFMLRLNPLLSSALVGSVYFIVQYVDLGFHILILLSEMQFRLGEIKNIMGISLNKLRRLKCLEGLESFGVKFCPWLASSLTA
jgi:nitrate reductase NapE component